MKKRGSGFTLIELIAVMVILGVLAATTAPRFIDLSGASQDVIIKKISGVLTSATSLNHANNIARDAGFPISDPFEITSCSSAEILLESSLSDQYFIESGFGKAIEDGGVIHEGGSSECLIAFDSNKNGIFNLSDEPRDSFTVYGVRN